MSPLEFYLVATFSSQLAACATRGVDPLCAQSIAHEATDQLVSGMAPAWIMDRLIVVTDDQEQYQVVLNETQRIISSMR